MFRILEKMFFGIPDLDAPHLKFKHERQFARFLRYYGLADYSVALPKFAYGDNILSVVPTKQLQNKAGQTVTAPDPSYYNVGVPDNSQYLYEDLYAGKRYVSFFDHNNTAKFMREMVPVYCPDAADLIGIDETYTNPYTGQKVTFKDVYQWSDRNGEHIFNRNLKIWLLWNLTGTVTLQIDAVHGDTGCDMTFREWFPGHTDMTLYFQNLVETYGHLKGIA